MFKTLFLETPCSIYVNVTDPTRFWESRSRSVDAIQRSCQNYEFPFWTRFLYSNTSNAIIPQNCTPAILNKGNPPCGALYRGRIQGEHPSTEDGRYIAFFLSIALSYQVLLLFLIFRWCLKPIKCQRCPHIETSQLIFKTNQLTGFYMRAILAFNGLIKFLDIFSDQILSV